MPSCFFGAQPPSTTATQLEAAASTAKRSSWAAQEGRFLGGDFGEVRGAKLVGLLRARDGAGPDSPRTVLSMLDTGGDRLQKANAGER